MAKKKRSMTSTVTDGRQSIMTERRGTTTASERPSTAGGTTRPSRSTSPGADAISRITKASVATKDSTFTTKSVLSRKRTRRNKDDLSNKPKPILFEASPREWWEVPLVQYAFTHPRVRSTLERLMGSNIVRLTDRKYIQRLNARIMEDYIQSMNKRIATRAEMERERVKGLVLSGKIPFNKAPPEMHEHPVILIEEYCNRLIEERRAKIKVRRAVIPLFVYVDDTPDPLPSLSITEGHIFRATDGGMLCIPPEVHLAFSEKEEIANGYMFTDYEFAKRFNKDTDDLRRLGVVGSVDEMYALADRIIGPLKTIDDKKA